MGWRHESVLIISNLPSSSDYIYLSTNPTIPYGHFLLVFGGVIYWLDQQQFG